MASYTTNLNLKKPAGSESVSIGDINNNMDTIDQAYGALDNKIIKVSETITTDSNGVAITSYSRSEYTCISVTSGNSIVVPFVQTNGDGGKIGVRVIRQNGNPITAETFSINLHLLKMSS